MPYSPELPIEIAEELRGNQLGNSVSDDCDTIFSRCGTAWNRLM